MKEVWYLTSDQERAFYASSETKFFYINIQGPADGESAFKESKNINVYDSNFFLRYPFWHNNELIIERCNFEKTARAAFWYCQNISLKNVICNGVKALRESGVINISYSTFVSEEFAWKCSDITLTNSSISGDYAFFESQNIALAGLTFKGKYSFQYVQNMMIKNSSLNTKDAFWHTKNVTVENTVIEGEYLGWYSEDLTLIRCHIKGTQPLCYCKNLKLIDCSFESADLAFEYSEVNGNITSPITSIKNPLKGKLKIAGLTNLLVDENDRSNGEFTLEMPNTNYYQPEK